MSLVARQKSRVVGLSRVVGCGLSWEALSAAGFSTVRCYRHHPRDHLGELGPLWSP